jgi:hypothetical protein
MRREAVIFDTEMERHAHTRNVLASALAVLALVFALFLYLKRRARVELAVLLVGPIALSGAQLAAAPSTSGTGVGTIFRQIDKAQGRVRQQKLTFRVTTTTFPSPELRDPQMLATDLDRFLQTIPASLSPEHRTQEEKQRRESFFQHMRGGTASRIVSYSFRRQAPGSELDAIRIETNITSSAGGKAIKRTIELFDGHRTYRSTPELKQVVVESGNQVSRRSLPEEMLVLGALLSRLMPSSTTKVLRDADQIQLQGSALGLGVQDLTVRVDPDRGYEIVGLESGCGQRVAVLSSLNRSGLWVPSKIVHDVYARSPKYGRRQASRTEFNLLAATVAAF